tara:strand:- start:288 stop:437 length:150 start_codon:yes stop_codon:yes gene_type:complete
MNLIFASTTEANALFAIAGIGILIGSYFFGRLITFVWPNNFLVKRKGDS